jgi:hypothetical protein
MVDLKASSASSFSSAAEKALGVQLWTLMVPRDSPLRCTGTTRSECRPCPDSSAT